MEVRLALELPLMTGWDVSAFDNNPPLGMAMELRSFEFYSYGVAYVSAEAIWQVFNPLLVLARDLFSCLYSPSSNILLIAFYFRMKKEVTTFVLTDFYIFKFPIP